MKGIFFCLIMASIIGVQSQSDGLVLNWAQGFGPPSGSNCVSNDIAVDADGNSYIIGFFSGTVDFDPSTFTYNLVSTNGNADIFIAKYDATGDLVYAQRMGGTGSDIGRSLEVDANGNVYIAGHFTGTANMDPVSTANITSLGDEDMFFAKYGPTGNYIYAKSIGSAAYIDEAIALAIDGAGKVYLTGFFGSTVDFNPGAGVANLTSNDAYDIFFAKYDENGDYIYAHRIGGNHFDVGLGIAVDAADNVYISGYYNSSTDFDPGIGTAILNNPNNNYDIFFAKYDAAGNYVYAKGMGSAAGIDVGIQIKVDAAGNVYLIGDFVGTVDFDPGLGTANLTSAGGSDSYIAKYNNAGNYLFAKKIGGTGNDVSRMVEFDSNGNIYVTGHFTGTADFDPGAGTANLVSAGGDDIYIAKYNASGNYVYAKRIGGTGGDLGLSLAIDGIGNIYTTGFYYGTVDFDPNSGQQNVTGLFTSNVYLAKYTEADARWTGASSTNWHTAANWSNNAVPTGTSNVLIPNATNDPIISSNAAINNLELLPSGSELTVADGGTLTLNGVFTINGTINIKSGGGFLQGNGSSFSASGSGGIFSIEREITNTADGYRDISSPLIVDISQIADNFAVFGQDGVQCWYSYSPYPNIQIYDEALTIVNGNYGEGWLSYTGTGNPMDAMKGIAIRTYVGAPFTIEMSGEPHNGTQTIPISKTTSATPAHDGWNFVGNPYPSTIDWVDVAAMNPGITGDYYVFNATGEYTGSWGTCNSVGVCVGSPAPTQYISSMQGFFVKANTASSSFVMDNTVRTTNTSTFYKNRDIANELRLRLSDEYNTDEIVVYTDANASPNYDMGMDAEKIPAGSTVYIGFNANDQVYSIDALNVIDETTVIPLSVWAQNTGSYLFKAVVNEVDGFSPYLKDISTGVETDLSQGNCTMNLMGNQNYTNYSIVFKRTEVVSGIIGPLSKTDVYSSGKVVFIQYEGTDAKVIIDNLLGQELYNGKLEQGKSSINLSNISSAYVLVRIIQPGKSTEVRKVYIAE